MPNNLKKLRKTRGWTQQDAADKLGISLSGYEKIERSERRLSADRIARVAALFKVSVGEIIDDDEGLPIVGEIGSAGAITLYPQDQSIGATAPRPEGAGAGMVALLVAKGTTLPSIAEENWLVYYEDKEVGVPEGWIGLLCVVETKDGEQHIRRVFHGRERETYDLVLSGFETIREVRIAWSAKVEWIKPR